MMKKYQNEKVYFFALIAGMMPGSIFIRFFKDSFQSLSFLCSLPLHPLWWRCPPVVQTYSFKPGNKPLYFTSDE